MKKTILYISPGPTYRPHSDFYQGQFVELSKYFTGYIFTTSSVGETFAIGEFTYISSKYNNTNIGIVKFFLFCLWNSIKLLFNGKKIDMVTTYDPLKSGAISLLISSISRAKFVPEVNGVYTSSCQWLDTPNSLQIKFKKTTYPLIMNFVLKHSDGIKLLFENQIDPSIKSRNGKIVRSFSCFVPVEHFINIRENNEILFVGFPFKLKGIDILIKAFKLISDKYPTWKLKILGWFPDPYELHRAIDGHPQIYLHKPVPYQEMPEHIGSCAILVLPSRSEAMGRVLVEAMAAGKPRIGSNVDGIPTVINDGIDGLLFESENVDDLAGKLEILMSNPDLRYKLGKAGESRARTEFTKEQYIRKLMDFYNEVLNRL